MSITFLPLQKATDRTALPLCVPQVHSQPACLVQQCPTAHIRNHSCNVAYSGCEPQRLATHVNITPNFHSPSWLSQLFLQNYCLPSSDYSMDWSAHALWVLKEFYLLYLNVIHDVRPCSRGMFMFSRIHRGKNPLPCRVTAHVIVSKTFRRGHVAADTLSLLPQYPLPFKKE